MIFYGLIFSTIGIEIYPGQVVFMEIHVKLSFNLMATGKFAVDLFSFLAESFLQRF
jgi:hypothetical protein